MAKTTAGILKRFMTRRSFICQSCCLLITATAAISRLHISSSLHTCCNNCSNPLPPNSVTTLSSLHSFSLSRSLPLQSLLAGGARADSVYRHAFHILQKSLHLQQILNTLLSEISIHVSAHPPFPACVLDSLSCLIIRFCTWCDSCIDKKVGQPASQNVLKDVSQQVSAVSGYGALQRPLAADLVSYILMQTYIKRKVFMTKLWRPHKHE